MAAVTENLLVTFPTKSDAGASTLPGNARAVVSVQAAGTAVNKEEQMLCVVLIEHLVMTL